jgi:hypothetical protein
MLLLVSFVSASDLCKESDDGRDYEEAGYVKYGVTIYDDLCVLSANADLRLPESSFLKEYYCDDDERKHKIIECAREGFDKCEDGRCIGAAPAQDSNTTPVYTGPECGNKKIETNEDCDPPTKICYVGSDIGLCSANCKCEIKITADGSDSQDESETTDEETTTEEDTTETEEKTVETKPKTTVEDKDGISTQQDRLALPKEPKKGLFGRVWNWFLDIFR